MFKDLSGIDGAKGWVRAIYGAIGFGAIVVTVGFYVCGGG